METDELIEKIRESTALDKVKSGVAQVNDHEHLLGAYRHLQLRRAIINLGKELERLENEMFDPQQIFLGSKYKVSDDNIENLADTVKGRLRMLGYNADTGCSFEDEAKELAEKQRLEDEKRAARKAAMEAAAAANPDSAVDSSDSNCNSIDHSGCNHGNAQTP